MPQKVRWGILGLGKIARKFASDLRLSDGAILQAVASRDGEKAQDFAREFGAIDFYDSYEAMVESAEIDIVHIATPHVFHFEQTMLCLENGKAVLCEKPLGMNQTEVETVIATAKEKNLFLMEGMWTRFIPATLKLLELIDSEAIGEIQFIRADFGFKATGDKSSRIFDKNLGAGSLLDIGIYPVYLSLLLFGIPNEIKALARMSDTGADAYCSMIFDYSSIAKASLESTFEANTPVEAMIYGSKGSLKLHRPFHHSERFSLLRDGHPEVVFDVPLVGEGYFHEIEAINRCMVVSAIECEKHPHQTSLDLIIILDRVRREIGLYYPSRTV
jgi:predicted dehydrogenase